MIPAGWTLKATRRWMAQESAKYGEAFVEVPTDGTRVRPPTMLRVIRNRHLMVQIHNPLPKEQQHGVLVAGSFRSGMGRTPAAADPRRGHDATVAPGPSASIAAKASEAGSAESASRHGCTRGAPSVCQTLPETPAPPGGGPGRMSASASMSAVQSPVTASTAIVTGR